MCAYGSIVCMLLFRGEIKEKKLLENTFLSGTTGEEFESSWFVVSQYLFAQRTPECCVLIVMVLMGIFVGIFLGYHMYLSSINQTSNEYGKWQIVRENFKTEKKRYDDALKAGKIDPSKGTQQTDSKPEFFDPGPVPKNLYNRGFVENWKEVIFPISLRHDAVILGGYSTASDSNKAKSN